jgi:hypothetical protein
MTSACATVCTCRAECWLLEWAKSLTSKFNFLSDVIDNYYCPRFPKADGLSRASFHLGVFTKFCGAR